MNAQRHATTQDVCNAIREWHMPNHDDLIIVTAGFAAKVKNSSFLSAAAAKIIVDMLDEVVGQIENDQCNQLEEMNHD